jgi:TfoX/Sxy family transcriptional regulator of competence genes
MAYNAHIADRIREALADLPEMEEKLMFGGSCFMVNGKMCLGVVKDEMMCRIGPDAQEEALQKHGCRPMDFSGKPMDGYVYVSEDGMKSKKDFDYWVSLCLQYNDHAKASKKKKK